MPLRWWEIVDASLVRGKEPGRDASGSLGVKVPSSRSLSYTRTVPSACETRKSTGERGTQRTDVHGEDVMHPCVRAVNACDNNAEHGAHLLIQAYVTRRNGVCGRDTSIRARSGRRCAPNQTRSPVLKPMTTSSLSGATVSMLMSWHVGYAEKVIRASGSCARRGCQRREVRVMAGDLCADAGL